jgi:hypothetical protein
MAVVAIGVAIALAADPYLQAVLVAAVARRVRRPAAQMPRRQAPPLFAAATPTAQTYLRWNLWLARLRLDLQPAQTPFERAAAFSDLMPEGREAAWAIAEAYAAERFGGRAPDGAAVRQAWRFLYPRVWLAWLQRSLDWLRDPRRNPRKRKSA